MLPPQGAQVQSRVRGTKIPQALWCGQRKKKGVLLVSLRTSGLDSRLSIRGPTAPLPWFPNLERGPVALVSGSAPHLQPRAPCLWPLGWVAMGSGVLGCFCSSALCHPRP